MGVNFTTYASIKVQILETIGSQARVKVTIDKDRVDLSLLRSNFRFFKYDQYTNRWNYIELPSDPVVTTSGEYLLNIPTGINKDAYFLQVIDRRGIMVTAAFIKGVGTFNKKNPSYTYTFNWSSEHNTLDDTPIVVELLQDGTLRWLGEDLPIVGGGTSKRPIPPIPVKGIRVNATLKSDLTKSSEIPFQIEDWGSYYQVPYGITSNNTIFNENCMIVFLVNYKVDHITVWWDGRDVAKQREYGYKNYFFAGDNPAAVPGHLSNGIINLDFSLTGDGYVRASTASGTLVDSQAKFMRINSEPPANGAQESYIIYHGVVRDIVQQEAEWNSGIPNSPNTYSHLVFTLPAKANYYTYQLRMIFVESTQTRNLSDLSLLRLKGYVGSRLTEDGLVGVPPNTTPRTDGSLTLFYNGGTRHEHQWSQFTDSNNMGVGVMYTPTNNDELYHFDPISVTGSTGALYLDTTNRIIEVDPVRRANVNNFQQADDQIWKGAIVISGGGRLPIYPTSGTTGLWILVEKLPAITVS